MQSTYAYPADAETLGVAAAPADDPGAATPYDVVDPAFGACIDLVAPRERLFTGCRWAEGPVYLAEYRRLIWSDIPNQRLLQLDETTGAVSVLRSSPGYANGNTRDLEGRLVTCEQGAGRVVRTEPDGTTTVLADRFEGGRLNAPNDVVVRSDGTIWFTDPSYGRDSHVVGIRRAAEQTACRVYALDPARGELRSVAEDFWMPNGLAFSPDERTLYVVDSGFLPDPAGPRHVRRFSVDAGGGLTGGEVLVEIEPGIPDGLRVDVDGRLWIGAGDGVHCVSPDGVLLGKIRVPEAVANVTFGGPKRNRLYMTATTSLYAVHLNTTGVQRP